MATSVTSVEGPGEYVTIAGEAIQLSASISSVTVSNFPATQTVNGAVTVSNTPGTQLEVYSGQALGVSGTVSIGNFPTVQFVANQQTVGVSGSVKTQPVSCTTATSSSATVTTTSQLLASNTNRLGAFFQTNPLNTGILLLGFGASPITGSFNVMMPAGSYYEVPFGYLGSIWGVAQSGFAQVWWTELTA
jgi:hypothetical protein